MKKLLRPAIAATFLITCVAAEVVSLSSGSAAAAAAAAPVRVPVVAAAPFPTINPNPAPGVWPAQADPAFGNRDVRRLVGHSGFITAVAVSPDGRWAASRSTKQLIRWDFTARRALGPAVPVDDQPFGLSVGADGKVIATDRGALLVFDDARSKPRRIELDADAPARRHWSLALSPDGKFVAAGGADGAVRLLDVTTGRSMRTFEGHDGMVTAIACAADGRTILSGGKDGSVRLWDLASGQGHKFEGHSSMIAAVRYSADGTHALSFARSMVEMAPAPNAEVKADPFLRVWDLVAKEQSQALPVPPSVVVAATFTPDGSQIAAASGRELVVWDSLTARRLWSRPLLPDHFSAQAVLFSHDCRTLLVGGDNNAKRVVCHVDLTDELTGARR